VNTRFQQPETGRGHGNGIFLLVLLLVLGAGIWVTSFLWKRDLTVREVYTSGNRIVSTAELVRLANIARGGRLSDVDLGAAQKRVLKNTFVREASVHRDLPDRIEIRVEEREPVAALANERLMYVDAKGMVLPPVRSEYLFDLPVITGAPALENCAAGKVVTHPAITEALRLILAARGLNESVYRRISEVHILPGGDLMLYTAEFGVPVLVGRGDLVNKLVRLEGFWNTIVSSRGADALETVDIRFADQVVVRWEPTSQQQLH
jgi:cell division protein FtsQ